MRAGPSLTVKGNAPQPPLGTITSFFPSIILIGNQSTTGFEIYGDSVGVHQQFWILAFPRVQNQEVLPSLRAQVG